MDLKAIASRIPDYAVFLTVDELHASSRKLVDEFPTIASLRTVGRTRSDEAIELLTIGDGEKQAFIFGGPHPNEPIGTMTIEFLSRLLCEDHALREEMGYTWHFIKCIDVDGMRLNEGWFKGPFTPTNYARHFFRPAPFDQVEWTFPFKYKDYEFDDPMPETQALMKVIDEVKPTLLYSLHNAGFGGVYYYVTERCDPLYDLFYEVPGWFDLPLDLGEPEVKYAVQYAPAIYEMIESEDSYDYMEENGIDPATVMQAGGSSSAYAKKHDTFTLVVEMPYYDDPRVNDQGESDMIRRDAILHSLDAQDEFDEWIQAQMESVQPHLTQETLLSRAVTAFLKTGKSYRDATREWAKNSEETERKATHAEAFSSLLGTRFYRQLMLGMFARWMQEEIDAGNNNTLIAAAGSEAAERLKKHGADLEDQLDYRVIPIRHLVGVQACVGLATAAYLRERP